MAKILIIDDDSAAATAVAQALNGAGHSCAVRQDGVGAVEIVKNARPDLVILDLMLPGVSGFEVCRSIRRDSAAYTVPILILSGMDGPEEIAHGLAQGADDFLPKPVNAGVLMQRVEGLLRHNGDAENMDAITGIANGDGTRRELQRRIVLDESFGLVYVEILNIRELIKKAGTEARDKVTRHMARALKQCSEEIGADRFFCGHMGAGHFLALVPTEKVKAYCKKVQATWKRHLDTLYPMLGLRHPAQDKQSIALELMLFETNHHHGTSVTPQGLLDTLSRLRQSQGDHPEGGIIFLDRRGSSS